MHKKKYKRRKPIIRRFGCYATNLGLIRCDWQHSARFLSCCDERLASYYGITPDDVIFAEMQKPFQNRERFRWECLLRDIENYDQVGVSLFVCLLDQWKKLCGARLSDRLIANSGAMQPYTDLVYKTKKTGNSSLRMKKYRKISTEKGKVLLLTGKNYDRDISELLAKETGISVEKGRLLSKAISEAIINVTGHAYGGISMQPIGDDVSGIVTLNELRRWWLIIFVENDIDGRVSATIVDRGDGIALDLRRQGYYSNLRIKSTCSDEQLIKAFVEQKGVPNLVNSRGKRRGYGFRDILAPAIHSDINMFIATGKALCRIASSHVSVNELPHPIKGTAICWETFI